MKIGIIGIGTLTLELARRSCLSGYQVIVNNPRGNSLVRDLIEKMGDSIHLDSLEKAADTDIVLLFIPKEDLETVIVKMPDMTGKIIIHTSSLVFNPNSLLPGISNAMTFGLTASLLPEAHVSKLFNPVKLEKIPPCLYKNKEEIFFSASHSESKEIIRAFLKKLDFQPVDLTNRIQHRNAKQTDECSPAVFHSLKNYPREI